MSIVGYWNTSRSQSARTFVRRCSSQSKNTGLADGQLRMTVLMDSFSAIAEVRGERFEYSQGTRLNQCCRRWAAVRFACGGFNIRRISPIYPEAAPNGGTSIRYGPGIDPMLNQLRSLFRRPLKWQRVRTARPAKSPLIFANIIRLRFSNANQPSVLRGPMTVHAHARV